METKINGRKSATTVKHKNRDKGHTPDPVKKSDNKSGVRNISSISISSNDKLISDRNLLVKTFSKYKFASIKVTDISDRRIFFRGRELYMRTGEYYGSYRNFSWFSEDFSGSDRGFFEVSGSLSEVIISFSGTVRRNSEVLKNFSEMFRKFHGSDREIYGLLR
jgi:hypothetical protein